jgi:hypothetical protein
MWDAATFPREEEVRVEREREEGREGEIDR